MKKVSKRTAKVAKIQAKQGTPAPVTEAACQVVEALGAAAVRCQGQQGDQWSRLALRIDAIADTVCVLDNRDVTKLERKSVAEQKKIVKLNKLRAQIKALEGK